MFKFQYKTQMIPIKFNTHAFCSDYLCDMLILPALDILYLPNLTYIVFHNFHFEISHFKLVRF